MEKIRRDMGMYNCVVECDVEDKDLSRYVNAVVDERVEMLLADLSRKRPQWVFVTSGYGSAHLDGIHRNFSSFTIEDDGEVLGTIETEKDWRNGETVFCLHNKRLNSKRERNGPTKTRKRDKAVKLILANYYLKTIPELASEAASKTSALLDKINRDAGYLHDRTIGANASASIGNRQKRGCHHHKSSYASQQGLDHSPSNAQILIQCLFCRVPASVT